MFGLVDVGWTWSLKASLNVVVMIDSMKGAVLFSCSWVTLSPAVSIMFPLLVQLAKERQTAA